MPQISGNRIIYDHRDWLAGLHPQHTASTSLRQKASNKLASARAFDPYREFGYAYPGFNPTDVANVSIVDSVLLNAAVNGQYAYMISAGTGKEHRSDLAASGDLVNDTAGTGFPHTIDHAHASETGEDIVVYSGKVSAIAAARATYIFYSFRDATDWDIGVHNFATPAVFDDDFFSTQPTATGTITFADGLAAPHPLIVGDDDILYVGDRHFVHAYDGADAAANGRRYAAVLTLPVGYIITSFAKYNNYLVIFAYKTAAASGSSFYRGEATAFFWNYVDEDPWNVVPLNDNYVVGGFQLGSTIGCFTSGRPNQLSRSFFSRVQIFNGSRFEPKVEYLSNPPVNGGVEVIDDVLYWAASDGSVIQLHTWGAPFAGEGIPRVHNILTEGLGNTPGLYKLFTSTLALMSSGTTTSGGLQTLTSNYNPNAQVATSFAEPIFPKGMHGKVKEIKVVYAASVSGGRSVTVQVRNSNAELSEVVTNATAVSAGSLAQHFTLDSSGAPLISFDSLKCILVWQTGSGATAAPGITRVEVDFEPVTVST